MPFRASLQKFLDKVGTVKDQEPLRGSPDPPPVPHHSTRPKSTTSTITPATYWEADFSSSASVSTNFAHETGDGGWGNNELENYTDNSTNSFHSSNDELVLRALVNSKNADNKTRYTSARLTSHQRLEKRRGYVEATITAPSAKGIWPAFWLLPADPFKWPEDGEVDIFEAWNGEAMNHSCLHWGHFNGPDSQKHRVTEHPIHDMRATHSYGFAWEQPEGEGEGGRCVWYIDGKSVMKAQKPAGTRRFEDWRIILNVAIGGDVCQGKIPTDGTYDMIVHELKMCLGPEGRWQRFERDWVKTKEGHAM